MNDTEKTNVQNILATLDTIEPSRAVIENLDAYGEVGLQVLVKLAAGQLDAGAPYPDRVGRKATFALSRLLPKDRLGAFLSTLSGAREPDKRRIAAASAYRLDREDATMLTERLLADPDPVVVRVAAQSIPTYLLESLRPAIARAQDNAKTAYLRKILADKLSDMDRQKN